MFQLKNEFVLDENTVIYPVDVKPKGISELVTVYVIAYNGMATIIDPGPKTGINNLLAFLRERKLIIDKIILTHIHLDHAGGVGELVDKLEDSGVKIYVHPRGAKHLINPSRLWEATKSTLGELAFIYGEPIPVSEKIIVETTDFMNIKLDDFSLKILHTPGHASHHQSIFETSEKIMFTGDSLGMWFEKPDAFIPSTPPPFHYNKYIESLEKMMIENPSMIFFPHNTQKKIVDDIFSIHKKQLDLWISTTLTSLKKNERDVRKIIARISEKDDNLRRLLLYGKKEFVSLAESSIEGLIDFVEKNYLS